MNVDIKHQQQPNDVSCNHACIAMVLDVPVSEVMRIFQTFEGGMNRFECQQALEHCKLAWNAFVYDTLVCPGIYIVAAPSLNFPGGMHALILTVDDSWKVTVFDPQAKRDGKRFYGEGGETLQSWKECIYVVKTPDSKLPSSPIKLS